MNLGNIHVFNAAMLAILGGWSYHTYRDPSVLIPVLFGIALLSLSNYVRNGEKPIIKVCTILTIFALVSVTMIMVPRALETTIFLKQIRALLMTLSCGIALLYYLASLFSSAKR